MSRPHADVEQLQEKLHSTRLHFLTVELEVGQTMLATAASSEDPATSARRHARAQEAHDEVARQLARGKALGLTPSEHDQIATGLARLGERIAAAR